MIQGDNSYWRKDESETGRLLEQKKNNENTSANSRTQEGEA